MQPIVEDVLVTTQQHRNALMLWTNPHTAKTVLVRVFMVSTMLHTEIHVQLRLGPGTWSKPILVKCDELKWFREPDYTAEDLMK